MSPVTIRLVCLANGDPSPLDGKLVARYEPLRFKYRPVINDDADLAAFLDEWVGGTDDPAAALQFPDAAAAREFWQQPGHMRRPAPNRPLTAFSIEIEPLEEAR